MTFILLWTRQLISFFMIFLSALLISSFSFAAPEPIYQAGDIFMFNAAELKSFHASGGLGSMLEAYLRAASNRIGNRFPGVKLEVAMPFYMSLYDQPGLVDSMQDENREVSIGWDYEGVNARKSEIFHVFSLKFDGYKIYFYRHMNRYGEANLFDNRVPRGVRPIYAPNEIFSFALYGKALAKDILLNRNSRVKLVIEHDWHSGLNAYFLKHPHFFGAETSAVPKILAYIHNYEYSGAVHDPSFLERIGVDRRDYHADGVMHGDPYMGVPDHFSFLKALINYRDQGTTVSYQHAVETLGGRFGKSFAGVNVREARNFRQTGILNSVDASVWNPKHAENYIKAALAADPIRAEKALQYPLADYNFSSHSLELKAKGKAFVQRYFSLPEKSNSLLAVSAARIDWQKGFDFSIDALDQSLARHAQLQLIIIGNGEAKYVDRFYQLQKKYPEQFRYEFFSPEKEYILVGLADLTVNLSVFEPGGQVGTQGQVNGTLPLDTDVGGLLESVQDKVNGFIVHLAYHPDGSLDYPKTAERVVKSFDEVLALYQNEPETWREIQHNAASLQIFWDEQIHQHFDLFEYTLMNGSQILSNHLAPAEHGVVLRPHELLALAQTLPRVFPSDYCSKAFHEH